VWDVEKDKNINGEVLEGAGKSVYLGLAIRNIAHHYVLINTTKMAWWVR
jgi:hypothetical protein